MVGELGGASPCGYLGLLSPPPLASLPHPPQSLAQREAPGTGDGGQGRVSNKVTRASSFSFSPEEA